MVDSKDNAIFQKENQDYVINRLGVGQWTTVYSWSSDGNGYVGYFSGLLPNSMVESVLERCSWDLKVGGGVPYYGLVSQGEDEKIVYWRYGSEGGLEPLVLKRSFFDIKPSYIEISEEFRLFHNLYYDDRNKIYLLINDNGEEEIAIKVNGNEVLIKTHLLKRFLAAKEMSLVLYFDIFLKSKKNLEVMGLTKESAEFKGENYVFHFHISELDNYSDGSKETSSRLVGRKIISSSSCVVEDFADDKRYEEFVVNIDEEGIALWHTCNPASLGLDDPSSYLTPIYFKRDVLAKYYNHPEKYSVEDGYLCCGSLWGINIDNNHDDFVVVYLGDLGSYLPYKEQQYWKSFNVPPEGGVSAVNFKRSVLGQFADPEKADLVFKQKFLEFQEIWLKTYSWCLFKPLAENDRYLFDALRLPLVESQNEFDTQVQALAKILIDSINEKEIIKDIDKIENEKGISKLERFLESKGACGVDVQVGFLRNLQALRGGVAHRKSEKYERAKECFKCADRTFKKTFEDILLSAILLLSFLQYGVQIDSKEA